MSEPTRTSKPARPWYWIVAGVIVLVLAVGYTVDDTFPLALGLLVCAVGAGLVLYGIVATATQHGAAAARRDDTHPDA